MLLLVFAAGLLTGVAVASVFVVFGYKLARAHEDQIREFKEISSEINRRD